MVLLLIIGMVAGLEATVVGIAALYYAETPRQALTRAAIAAVGYVVFSQCLYNSIQALS